MMTTVTTSSSVLPLSRVPDILKRMDLNSSQAEAMKTCFGILAIMSREDSNKLLIARDGMEIILNAMTIHVDRTDVQESGCDLLWSLAFSNAAVKDIIAKHGGATVLVRALKRHNRSSDFLKSACGALSNMCQSKLNQEGVSTQGGLQPLVGAIHIHQTNAKLLPFIFDAIASIIVNNEDNARSVSSLGIIPIILASLSRHKTCTDVVKSGCHTLAILSDVKGQASKIAFAGGVPIILSLLDAHPLYSDLHRVAAVVLLRMLQESGHVGREITCHEGVRILLTSLEKGGAQQDTVAAVTHILYTVTNPSSAAVSVVESQLWLTSTTKGAVVNDKEHDDATVNRHPTNPLLKQSSKDVILSATSNSQVISQSVRAPAIPNVPPLVQNTALGGVALIMGQYCSRRDVVRAACRLVNNLTGYTNVVGALEKINILDRMLECVFLHKDTKDIIESTTSVIKIMYRRGVPVIQAQSASSIHGLLHLFKHKAQQDEEMVLACLEMFASLLETADKLTFDKRRELDDSRALEGKLWEHHALAISVTLLEGMMESEKDGNSNGTSVDVSSNSNSSLVKSISSALRGWSKSTSKIVTGVILLIESAHQNSKLSTDAALTKDCVQALMSLQRVIPSKNVDLHKRVDKILPLMDSSYGQHQLQQMQQRRQLQQDRILAGKKPPRLAGSNAEIGLEPLGSSTSALTSNSSVKSITNTNAASNSTGSNMPSRDDSIRGKSFCVPVENTSGTDPLEEGNETKANPANQSTSSITATTGVPDNGNRTNENNNSRHESASASEKSNLKSVDNFSPPFSESVLPNGVKVITPQHPSKSGSRNLISTGSQNSSAQLLLDCWPNYLERLLPSSGMNTNGNLAALIREDAHSFSRMHIAYESLSAAGKGLVSKCPAPIPYSIPPEGAGLPFEHTLTFDSEFESGNLLRAVQKGDSSYDLFLRSDLHTAGHTQWFYFAIANSHPPELVRLSEQGVSVPPVRVRFNIINFTKPDSLFNIGMRPVVYSCVDASTKGIGWVRAGSDISYYSNSFQRNNNAGEGAANYFTLSFTLEFQNPKDTVLIAYSYPYTFGDYKCHLQQLLDKPGASGIIRQTKLCRTIGGEDCDLLVITNFRDKEGKDRIGPFTMAAAESSSGGESTLGGNGNSGSNNNGGFGMGGNSSFIGSNLGGQNTSSKISGVNMSRRESSIRGKQPLKPALFLSGRVHPGETPASWMMKGILDYLTSDCSQAKLLRQVFVIFVVPILNPDGVIYGNNRCSLAGVDLNRQWKLPSKTMHPTIYALKLLMVAQRKIREISMYVDLHGHSRKYNVFMYGCDDKKKPKPQVRAFPKFFSMHSVGRKYVCYSDCSFHVKKGRESTARVVVAKEINIPCSFTLEATFCGSNYGPLKFCHMHIGHMQEVGAALCDAILNFSISEGQVKDPAVLSMVPAINLKAVAQVEKALAELRGNDSEGRNDDFDDEEGSVKSKYFRDSSLTGSIGGSGSIVAMYSAATGNRNYLPQQQFLQQEDDSTNCLRNTLSSVHSVATNISLAAGDGSSLTRDSISLQAITDDVEIGIEGGDMDILDDTLLDNKEDIVSDESDNENEADEIENENDIEDPNTEVGYVNNVIADSTLPDLGSLSMEQNEKFRGRESPLSLEKVNTRTKSLSAEIKRSGQGGEDTKMSGLTQLMPSLTFNNSSKKASLNLDGINSLLANENTSSGALLLPLAGGSSNAGNGLSNYYINGSSLGTLKTWNGSNPSENGNNSGNGSSSPLRGSSSIYSKEKDKDASVGIVNIFYPLSDRTSKHSKTENNGDSFGGFVGSSTSVSGAGMDQFVSHELSTQSIVSSSQESNKESLFSKSKKIADTKKKKVATGSSIMKVNGKKVSGDSLMVNGATSTGTFSLNDNAKSTDAVGASVDFEIMDSPRNATSSVGASSMKAMKGSTIVKSDYVDSPVNNATSDFGSLNNLNLVKAQAPATTFGLPKVSQAQVKQ